MTVNNSYKKFISFLCCITFLFGFSISTYAAPTLNEIKAKSYKHFEMKTKDDTTYDVYLYSDTGNIHTITEPFAGYSTGDKVTVGDLKLAYALKGSSVYKTYTVTNYSDIADNEINLSREHAKVVYNYYEPAILVLMRRVNSNSVLTTCYAIVNNMLQPITFVSKNGETSLYEFTKYTGLETIGNRYVTCDYNNGLNYHYFTYTDCPSYKQDDIGWIANFYKYDPNKNQLIRTDSHFWFNEYYLQR